MLQRLPGVAKTTKKLADGTKREYYYAWRGGPLLKDERGVPLHPSNPSFSVAYADAHRERKKIPQGTLFSLIAEFRASAEFTSLSEKAKRDYRRYLTLIEGEFGDAPTAVLEDPRMRGEFKAWRDTMADRPRVADYAWTVLARVLSVAKDRGRITVNVCERGGRLYEADRAEKIWTEEHVRRFMECASEELQLALILALWTGQRQGDLLGLRWSDYDGKAIRLRQGKCGKHVVIPVGPTLRDHLKRAKRRGGTILTNISGSAWTEDGFRSTWSRACRRAVIDDVTFHDIRGSAITRLALAGASVPEIASLTGHSLKDVETILDAHYLGRDVKLAESAMRKRERKERRERPIRFQMSGAAITENHE